MTTVFHLEPGELNEKFLEKLRALFSDRGVEVVVYETDADRGSEYPFDNPAQLAYLEDQIRHYENGGPMIRVDLDELWRQ